MLFVYQPGFSGRTTYHRLSPGHKVTLYLAHHVHVLWVIQLGDMSGMVARTYIGLASSSDSKVHSPEVAL